MNNKLLSIVVPTKNRYEYLKFLIQLISTFDTENIELVIQDNSDDNAPILHYLSNGKYSFVRYFYTKEPISVSLNSDLAILNSSGEYVCFIGDDDGVTRYIVDCVQWMKDNNINILKSSYAIFKWPSFISPKHYCVSGVVLNNDFSFNYHTISTKKSLLELLGTGLHDLSCMPKVYNGIVKRSVLDKIYLLCKTFFPGPSPDMANAVALAVNEDTYTYVDAPIVIGGQSSQTGGEPTRYKKGYGPLEEQPFLSKEDIEGWNCRIPKIWASRSVWPESVITSLKALNKEEYIDKIDFEVVYRKFAVTHPELASMVYPLSSNKIKLFFSIQFHQLVKLVFLYINYFKYKIKNQYEGLYIHRGFNNIIEAEDFLSSTITEFRPVAK